MTKLLWGVLSTARISRRILPSIARSERSVAAAVASRELDPARSFAKKWNIPKAYGDYDALLSDAEIDAVYIPLPNHLHCEWAVKACEAGKHVLCEKPLALSVGDVDRMYGAARRAKVVLIEAFQFRFHPLMRMVREFLQEERLGKPLVLKGHFSFLMSDPDNIRLRRDAGGGCLWDIGCYPISFMQGALGQNPREVFGWRRVGPTGVDVLFAGQFRFADGVLGQFECGFLSPYRVGAEVVCEKGTLHVPEAWRAGISAPGGLLVETAEGGRPIPAPQTDPFQCEIEAMEEAVLNGVAPALGHADSRGTTAAVLACLRSAESGRPAALADFLDGGAAA